MHAWSEMTYRGQPEYADEKGFILIRNGMIEKVGEGEQDSSRLPQLGYDWQDDLCGIRRPLSADRRESRETTRSPDMTSNTSTPPPVCPFTAPRHPGPTPAKKARASGYPGFTPKKGIDEFNPTSRRVEEPSQTWFRGHLAPSEESLERDPAFSCATETPTT